jgi:hypothetical protein
VPTLCDYLDRPNGKTQPWTLIFDLEDTHLPMRLVGTQLGNIMGKELTGTDNLLVYPEHQRADFMRRHRLLALHPCGMKSFAVSSTLKGAVIEMTGIALPLARANGAMSVVRVIEVLQAVGTGNQLAQVSTAPKPSIWIDIGAGVPA